MKCPGFKRGEGSNAREHVTARPTATMTLTRRNVLKYGAAAGALAVIGARHSMLEARSPSLRLSPYGLPGGVPFKGPASALKAYNPNVPAGMKPPSSLPKSLAWDTEADTAYWLSYRLGLSQAAADNGLSFAWANSNGDGSTAVGQLNEFVQRAWAHCAASRLAEPSPSSLSKCKPSIQAPWSAGCYRPSDERRHREPVRGGVHPGQGCR